MILVTNGVL